MTVRMDDRQVDALSFSPPAQPGIPLIVDGDDDSEATMLVRSALWIFTPTLLRYLAGGLLAREGIQVDEVGIRYPGDELDDGEEPFEGVKLVSPMGEVLMSLDALERLMARYLTTYIAWLDQTQDPVTKQLSFDTVRQAATALAERQNLRT